MSDAAGARADRVSVIGTGAVGTAVVRLLVDAGRTVTVWNRSRARTDEAVRVGATVAASAQEAVTASPVTLVTLSGHDAVRAVLGSLSDAAGRTVVVLTTGSRSDARTTARAVAGVGAAHLDGGLQAGPDDLGTEAATILYAGPRPVFDEVRPVLEILSTPRYVGASIEAAAAWDLALFGLWYDAQLGVLRAIESLRRAGVEDADLAGPFRAQLAHVVDAVEQTVDDVRRDVHPRGPADLTEHLPVLEDLVEMRRELLSGDGGLTEIHRITAGLIARGSGRLGLSALTSDRLHGR